MSFEISSIAGKGELPNERLVLRAVTALDAGHYAVLQTGCREGNPTSLVHHCFWFPWYAVKPNDLIVLYTKSGTQSTKSLADGRTAHFFYWNLAHAIWKSDQRAAVVLHAPKWISKLAAQL